MLTPPKQCSLPRCPKCGYTDGAHTWRGPKFVLRTEFASMGHIDDDLEFTCKGCGFKCYERCCDAS